MIGISIAEKNEWLSTLKHFNKTPDKTSKSPFGEYFVEIISEAPILFYKAGYGKTVSSAATQYFIGEFNLDTIIVAGTCGGVNPEYKLKDIIIPNKVAPYDCTLEGLEPLIKDKDIIEIDISNLPFPHKTGFLATADKPLVLREDHLKCLENNIDAVDMEAASIAKICKINNVECLIIKGISDFPENADSLQEASDKQFEQFYSNIEPIMTDIFENYLPHIIKLCESSEWLTPVIKTERLILRPIEFEDTEAMFKNWASDSDVCKYLSWPPHDSIEKTKSVIASWKNSCNPFHWAITVNGTIIGTIGVVRTFTPAKSCSMGYCIGKKWWGNGYVAEALSAIIDYLFTNTEIMRIAACHISENPNSGKVMQKAGMRYEGTLRNAGRCTAGIKDVCQYGLLRKDWEERGK